MLATPALKAALIAAFSQNIPGLTAAQTTALDKTCDDIANAMEAYVKTATITYVSGLGNSGGPVVGTMVTLIT